MFDSLIRLVTYFYVYISLPEYTFLLEIDEDGIITEAPPIAKWTIGKDQNYVVKYFHNRGATIKRLVVGS